MLGSSALATYAPHFRLSAAWSRTWADGVFGLGLAIVSLAVLVYALWAWGRANQLNAEVWKRRGLRPGPLLVPGVVHPIDDERVGSNGALIELTILQVGRQTDGKYGPHVHWRESSRELLDRPFLLRTDGGDEVRVEPEGRIALVDRLEAPVRHGSGRRLRIARIVPGERVWVRGVLVAGGGGGAGPYRGGGATPATLRPAPGAPLLVSSEPIDNELRASARYHFLFAVLFAALCAFTQGMLFRPYRALRAGAEVTEAMVTDHSTWTTRNKSVITHHYALRLEFECPTGRAIVVEETNGSAFMALADGDVAPISFDPADPSLAQIGRREEVGTTQARLTVALVATSMLLFVYVAATIARRPWWRRDKLAEVEKGVLV